MPQVFDSAERSITYYTATKTTGNISGSEKLTYSSGTSKKLIFLRGDKRHEYGMEGLFEKADAIILVRPSFSISKDDKFTVGSETFIIQATKKIEFAGNHLYTSAIALKYGE